MGPIIGLTPDILYRGATLAIVPAERPDLGGKSKSFDVTIFDRALPDEIALVLNSTSIEQRYFVRQRSVKDGDVGR